MHGVLVFDISTPFTDPIRDVSLPIFVSFENVNRFTQDRCLDTSELVVDEGGAVNITQRNLDASKLERLIEGPRETNSVKFVASRLPDHGWLLFNGINFTAGQVFLHDDLQKRRIRYQHDGSETTIDSFAFQVRLGSLAGVDVVAGIVGRQSAELGIRILPVDDQMFTVVFPKPSMTMVFLSERIIGPDVLQTKDEDTPPHKVVYVVTKPPDKGGLYLTSPPPLQVMTPCRRNCSFSQGDVNRGGLKYVNRERGASDIFSFEVSDGTHSPKSHVFTVHLSAIEVHINCSTLYLMQGVDEAILTAKHIAVRSNYPYDELLINVTIAPKAGVLFVEARQVSTFTASEVHSGLLRYVQKNLSVPEDSFSLVAFSKIHGVRSPERRFHMRVKADFETRELVVPGGSNVVIRESELDGRHLHRTTGKLPTYSLTARPRFGHLTLTKAQAGGAYRPQTIAVGPNGAELNIWSTALVFTQDDIEVGRVSYQANLVYDAKPSVKDHLRLMVSVGRAAQPALFNLTIIIQSRPGPNHPPGGGFGTKRPPMGREKPTRKPGTAPANSNVDEDMSHYSRLNVELFTVIIVVIAVICLGFIVIIVIHIVRRHRRQTEAERAAMASAQMVAAQATRGSCASVPGTTLEEIEEVKALTKPHVNGGTLTRRTLSSPMGQAMQMTLARSRPSNKLYLGTMAQLLQSGVPEEDEEDEEESSEDENSLAKKKLRGELHADELDTLRRGAPEPLLRSTKHWV